MERKETTITFQDGEMVYSVTVAEATALIGIRRTRLRLDGSEEKDLDRKLLHMYTFADCIAATVRSEGLDLQDFDAFCALPDSFVSQWETAVYVLNPHWVGKTDEDEDEDGDPKASSSTSDSPAGTPIP